MGTCKNTKKGEGGKAGFGERRQLVMLQLSHACVAQAAEPSSAAKRAQQPQGQRSKWGFVPGEDDTLDLNLEKAGRLALCFAVACLPVLL